MDKILSLVSHVVKILLRVKILIGLVELIDQNIVVKYGGAAVKQEKIPLVVNLDNIKIGMMMWMKKII